MKKSWQLKAVVAFLLLIVILLLMKNHEKCNTNPRFGIRRDDEEKERWIWEKYLPYCRWDENILRGRLHVNQESVILKQIKYKDQWLSDVKNGGFWSPQECQARTKVAIIIPFRNREKHLPVLLRHLHPVLQRQRLDYRIFVIKQVDRYPFNKGKLLNAGFIESQEYDSYRCFVFHDIDLIPEDDRNDYGCPSGPRHMCPAVSKFDYKLFSPALFGGVTAFTKEDFYTANGYPNRYYGWGAEDDDMYYRVGAKGMRIVRPPLEIGRYTMIVHKDEERNSKAKKLLVNAARDVDKDGLNSIRYKVKWKQNLDFYTEIGIDVEMTEEEEQITSLKRLYIKNITNPVG